MSKLIFCSRYKKKTKQLKVTFDTGNVKFAASVLYDLLRTDVFSFSEWDFVRHVFPDGLRYLYIVSLTEATMRL